MRGLGLTPPGGTRRGFPTSLLTQRRSVGEWCIHKEGRGRPGSGSVPFGWWTRVRRIESKGRKGGAGKDRQGSDVRKGCPCVHLFPTPESPVGPHHPRDSVPLFRSAELPFPNFHLPTSSGLCSSALVSVGLRHYYATMSLFTSVVAGLVPQFQSPSLSSLFSFSTVYRLRCLSVAFPLRLWVALSFALSVALCALVDLSLQSRSTYVGFSTSLSLVSLSVRAPVWSSDVSPAPSFFTAPPLTALRRPSPRPRRLARAAALDRAFSAQLAPLMAVLATRGVLRRARRAAARARLEVGVAARPTNT